MHLLTKEAARIGDIFNGANIIPSYTIRETEFTADLSRPENAPLAIGRKVLTGLFTTSQVKIPTNIEVSCDNLAEAEKFTASAFYQKDHVTYHLRRIAHKGGMSIMNLADSSTIGVINDPECELYQIVETLRPAYVSVHLGWSVEEVLLGANGNHDRPAPGSRQIPESVLAERIIENVKKLKQNLEKAGYARPVLIETLDYHEGGAYEMVTDPDFIMNVMKRSDARFLIDFGHLLCSAKNNGIYPPECYMDYVKKVVNAETIGLIDEFHIAVPARQGPRQYEDLHRPLTSTDAAGREFVEIMHHIFHLREQQGIAQPVIVNFETGIANAEKEIKALAAVLAWTAVGRTMIPNSFSPYAI
ncbi:MAG: DUF692 family protein [Deltaproteobacteria bacterium]|nr:DUF692 family protein [Deltaproteobacteria bacterium]